MFGRAKETTPNEPSRSVTSRDEPSQTDTQRTDMDMDLDLDSDSDLDMDSDSDSESDSDKDSVLDGMGILTSTKLMTSSTELLKRHYDYEVIDAIAQEVDEASAGEYPYSQRLVRRYYEINEENGWIGTDGKPIQDTMKWYMQYLDTELSNGYQVKSLVLYEYEEGDE